MYCRNYTGTVSHVLCREVYYTVSLFGESTIGSFTVHAYIVVTEGEVCMVCG